jgi:hypothetical protein
LTLLILSICTEALGPVFSYLIANEPTSATLVAR